ncbi:MAG: hypothetical protein H6835_11585 [Planctomycetes bacterium]|nr:hypothetical protein [Planctomycetota bacterium]
MPQDALDQKFECPECHRVFFPKTTAGKRVQAPDYTKAYLGFGLVAVAIVVIFVLSSKSPEKPKEKPKPVAQAPTHTVGNHPRARQLVAWAQAIASDNQLVMQSHSNIGKLATQLGVANDGAAVAAALRTDESTRYLRDLVCESAELSSDADMDAASGTGMVFVTPKPGDDNYIKNTRGEIVVTFDTEGNQIKVSGFSVKMKPAWNPKVALPGRETFTPNADIARAKTVEITDEAGTRKVQMSEPAPVPHWEKATPEQRQLADQVVADIVKSADPDTGARLFNRAILKVQEFEDKQACVPRVLNAMYERFADVNANNLELSQLNQALKSWTGYAVNYDVKGSGDAAKDKTARENCIRQWFAFWWRYSGDLSKWIDSGDPLLDNGGDDKDK